MSARLTAQEELELVDRARGGDTVALSELVSSQQGLIGSIVKQHAKPNREAKSRDLIYEPSLSREDLTSEGNIALLEALQRFSSTRGVRFSSYAYATIEGGIKGAIRSWQGGKVPTRWRDGFEVEELPAQFAVHREGGRLSAHEQIEESGACGWGRYDPGVAPIRTHRHRHRETSYLRCPVHAHTPDFCCPRVWTPDPFSRAVIVEEWRRRRKGGELVAALVHLSPRERDFFDLWRNCGFGSNMQVRLSEEMGIQPSRASKVKLYLLAKLERELKEVLSRPDRPRPQTLEDLVVLPSRTAHGRIWRWRFRSEEELTEACRHYSGVKVFSTFRLRGDDRGGWQRSSLLAAVSTFGERPSLEELLSQDGVFRVWCQNAEIDRIWAEVRKARGERTANHL